MNPPPSTTTIRHLIGAYDALLLDAYGVLVDKSGPLAGAAALIDRLNILAKPYYILTNSASRLPEAMAEEFQALGLAVPAERFITSGLLLERHFAEHGLAGTRCVVLGPEDAIRYVERAGGKAVALGADADADVVVLADQKGFPVLEGMDHALSLVLRRLDAGQPLHLVLCNPDLVYPVAHGQYGFTAGGLALMIEGVLRERYPEKRLGFARLGKPHAPIFEEAARRSGTRNLVMIGDQLATDILGANRCGIASALIGTGLARRGVSACGEAAPTYLLDSLVIRDS